MSLYRGRKAVEPLTGQQTSRDSSDDLRNSKASKPDTRGGNTTSKKDNKPLMLGSRGAHVDLSGYVTIK